MMEAMVQEVMKMEFDFGSFEHDEAVEIVEQGIALYEEDPECYDDIEDAIFQEAHERMYGDC